MLKILQLRHRPHSKHERKWRFSDLNMCRTGEKYFKSMPFYTTAPTPWTKHMELKCNHSFRHPPYIARDKNDQNRTRGTSAYTV